MTLPKTPLEWAHLEGEYEALAEEDARNGTNKLAVRMAINTHVMGCTLHNHIQDPRAHKKRWANRDIAVVASSVILLVLSAGIWGGVFNG